MKEVYKEEGVSEVVGTILILAITVALFATVFAYTQHIPPPSKSYQAIISPDIYVRNNVLFVNITDKGGSTFFANELYLIVVTNTTYSYPVSSIPPNLSTFGPGSSFFFSSAGKFNVYPNSHISVFLFSKQYNGIIWKESPFSMGGVLITYGYITPSLAPLQYSTVYAEVYSFDPSATELYLNASSVLGAHHNSILMNVSGTTGNIVNYYYTFQSPAEINGSAPFIITAKMNGTAVENYTIPIQTTSQTTNLFFAQNGIIISNSRPERNTRDPISILVQNNGNDGAYFYIEAIDTFPNGTTAPISTNYGLKHIGSYTVMNQTFIVGALDSTSINFIWNVTGTSNIVGGNTLTFFIVNISTLQHQPQSYSPSPATAYVYIIPRILLVDAEGPYFSTRSSVINYYESFLEYTGYGYTLQQVGNGTNASGIDNYDVVLWFTGNNSHGLTYGQSENLSYFYNHDGGKLFIVSGEKSSYYPLGYPTNKFYNVKEPGQIYINFTSSSSVVNSTLKSYKFYLTGSSFMYAGLTNFTSAPFYWFTPNAYPFMTYNYSSGDTVKKLSVGYIATSSSGGKAVVLGFELARAPLYMQDYIANKILMWLANITVTSGYQLALTDIEFSTTQPLYHQSVQITFYVANYSPQPLSTTLQVYVDGTPLGYPLVVNNIPGEGGYVTVNTTWIASPPGNVTITGTVDPSHIIQQVNYGLDTASTLVDTHLFVHYDALVIWVHGNSDHNNITAVTSSLNSSLLDYNFVNFNTLSPNINSTGLYNDMIDHNMVILDFNQTEDSLDSGNVLSTALNEYISSAKSNASLHSLLILGNNAYSAISANSTLSSALDLASGATSLQEGNYILHGNNNPYSISNFNAPTEGFGIYYNVPKIPSGTILYEVNSTVPSIPLFYYNANPVGFMANLSGLRMAFLPISLENIVGFYQNHTSSYSPVNLYSSPQSYASFILMFNIAVSMGYNYPYPFPEVLSPDFHVSSPFVTIYNYYVITGVVRNLGTSPTTVLVDLYEQGSLESSQTLYLQPRNSTPVQFIWKPNYASSPNPEALRVVISTQYLPELPTFEAVIPETVYYLFDNGSSLNGWNHYDVLAYISGEPLFGLTGFPPNSGIVTNFSIHNYSNDGTTIANGWSNAQYFSYPSSYYIADVIDSNGSSPGDGSYVMLELPSEHVSPDETLTLSWEWKYSIAEAQNGLFLMVEIGNTWYQVSLPYNSNPDLGNVLTINGDKIYEAYNGQSGGGTFAWTYHQISTSSLYVMNPTTGLPENNPMNVTGTTIQFAFVYISPAYYASSTAGSDINGAGTYIDNVMLSANQGPDGWRTISTDQSKGPGYYGIAQNGINYLGTVGSPTPYIIADYNNNSGYPTFDSSLWDNLVTPPIDLVSALNATMKFTFKANIPQGLYGAGWPGDFFEVSVSNNGGSSWEFLYSPPTSPSNFSGGGFYGNGGQSGGGTAYYTGSKFLPINGANSTFWLTVTLNLNYFIGQNIIIEFSIITNNGWDGNSNLFLPWHTVAYEAVTDNIFTGFYMTNIYVQGVTPSLYVPFNSLWT